MNFIRLLFLLLLTWSLAAQAQVEVITLKYRNAEQVLPILRPLVEPGGALTGMNNQLIIRASAANIADLRRVLASIDTLPRRLLISVRQDADASSSASGAALGGSVSSGPAGTRGSVNASVFDNRAGSQSNVLQTLQVMEGGVATINVGQAVPVRGQVVTRTVNGVVVQDTTSYRDVGTGFQVVPRVNGERVTLDINPHRDSPGPGGSVNVQRAATTVSGRLGEWLELGGMDVASSQSGSGILSGSNAQRNDRRGIWVKVEELK